MPDALRVLVVENSPADAEQMLLQLSHHGFAPDWRRAATEEEMRSSLASGRWDLVLAADAPIGLGALAAVAMVRAVDPYVPFIVVAAASGEERMAEIMRAGASGFLLKRSLVRLAPAVERELREAENRRARRRAELTAARLAAIVDSSDDAIISKTLKGVLTSWNPAAERLFGWTAEEAIGRDISLIVPLDRREELAGFMDKLCRGEKIHHFETIRLHKDGTPIDVSLTLSPILDPQGQVIGASKIGHDIRSRKHAEKHAARQAAALKESDDRFHQLADAMPQIVWTAGPDGRFEYHNRRWYEFTGFGEDQPENESRRRVLHPDDYQRWYDTWYGAVRSGEPFQIEYRFKDRQTGGYRWHLGLALPVKDEAGRVVRWFGTCTDVDDLKRTEERLKESERIYRAIGESIDYGVWVCDTDGKTTYASPSFLNLLGITMEECAEFGWSNAMHPDEVEPTVAAWKECVRVQGKWDNEPRFRGADGRYHTILARGMPVKDEDGSILCWAGINLDIGRLKQAEQDLQQARDELELRVQQRTAELTAVNRRLSREIEQRRQIESRLRERAEEMETLMEVLPVPVWIAHDALCRSMTGNRATYDLVRLPAGANVSRSAPPAELPATFRTFRDGKEIPPEDLPMQRAAATGRSVRDTELELVFTDGSARTIYGYAAPLFNEEGRARGCIGAFIDITNRRVADAALRESEERFRNAFDLAPGGMFLVGLDGRWLKVNPTLCRIVGRTEEEMLATTWMAITHPDDLEADLENTRKLVAGDIPYNYLEKRYLHKQGHSVWVLMGGSVVRDTGGRPLYAVGHVLDISQRKETEARLAASLAEKEVLLAEIHHRVKNNLQVISSLLHLQSGKAQDFQTAEMFRDSQGRVRAMALVHERLYRSRDLARIGFADYIRPLVEQLFRTYRVEADRIHLETEVQSVRLAIDTAVPCGLLLNELVSNCLKHAFPGGRKGIIRIRLWSREDNLVELGVSDDGVGLAGAIDLDHADTFGMQLVATLVNQLHGYAEIDREGGGTKFRITFPASKKPTEQRDAI